MSSNELPGHTIPGLKEVNSFGPDEDYEGEEETEYITLDLGNIEPALLPNTTTYRLIVGDVEVASTLKC